MVTTPLHLFNAIIVAMTKPEWESHLFFIDQPKQKKHLYFEALQAWHTSPFASVRLYQSRVKGVLAKWRMHRKTFDILEKDVEDIAPHRIYVGNDRRIEFAFAVSVARRIDPGLIGGYIDDGAYSYVHHIHKSRWYKDTFIDVALKRLMYGGWYFRHAVIGASDAVQEAFVALPEFVHKLLKTKRLFKLDTTKLLDDRLKPFTEYLLAPYHLDAGQIEAIDLIFILPHETLLEDFPLFKKTVKQSIESAVRRGLAVGVKYHPRQAVEDPLDFKSIEGILTLPNTLAFEVLLPLFGHPIIVGDVSTALLTARWLRPDLRVLSLRNEADTRHEEMAELFRHVGVEIVEPAEFLTIIEQELST